MAEAFPGRENPWPKGPRLRTLGEMRSLLLAAALVFGAFGCSAPEALESCESFCSASATCIEEDRGECLWRCLRRTELAEENSSACSRAMRNEIACRAGASCEVITDDRISRDEDCYTEARTRRSSCGDI